MGTEKRKNKNKNKKNKMDQEKEKIEGRNTGGGRQITGNATSCAMKAIKYARLFEGKATSIFRQGSKGMQWKGLQKKEEEERGQKERRCQKEGRCQKKISKEKAKRKEKGEKEPRQEIKV